MINNKIVIRKERYKKDRKSFYRKLNCPTVLTVTLIPNYLIYKQLILDSSSMYMIFFIFSLSKH